MGGQRGSRVGGGRRGRMGEVWSKGHSSALATNGSFVLPSKKTFRKGTLGEFTRSSRQMREGFLDFHLSKSFRS